MVEKNKRNEVEHSVENDNIYQNFSMVSEKYVLKKHFKNQMFLKALSLKKT